jgi:hypothetical protein
MRNFSTASWVANDKAGIRPFLSTEGSTPVEIIEQNPKLMAILEIFSECNQESVN